MNPKLLKTLQCFRETPRIEEERLLVLQTLIGFIQEKVDAHQPVNINFVCTHNSRRSHLAQVWAQAAAAYFDVPDVHCYSGGTEETALFPKIAETLTHQGYNVFNITAGSNPVYAIKYGEDTPPIIGFSKKVDHPFNPTSTFVAVMTCSQADEGCPFIVGAEKRISLPYQDPKLSDNTPEQTAVYAQGSLQIAAEMYTVFSKITK